MKKIKKRHELKNQKIDFTRCSSSRGFWGCGSHTSCESWVVLILHSFTSFNVVHFRSGIQLSSPVLAYHVTLPLQCEKRAQLKAKGYWILIQWSKGIT